MKAPKTMLEALAVPTTPPHPKDVVGEGDEQPGQIQQTIQPNHRVDMTILPTALKGKRNKASDLQSGAPVPDSDGWILLPR